MINSNLPPLQPSVRPDYTGQEEQTRQRARVTPDEDSQRNRSNAISGDYFPAIPDEETLASLAGERRQSSGSASPYEQVASDSGASRRGQLIDLYA